MVVQATVVSGNRTASRDTSRKIFVTKTADNAQRGALAVMPTSSGGALAGGGPCSARQTAATAFIFSVLSTVYVVCFSTDITVDMDDVAVLIKSEIFRKNILSNSSLRFKSFAFWRWWGWRSWGRKWGSC